VVAERIVAGRIVAGRTPAVAHLVGGMLAAVGRTVAGRIVAARTAAERFEAGAPVLPEEPMSRHIQVVRLRTVAAAHNQAGSSAAPPAAGTAGIAAAAGTAGHDAGHSGRHRSSTSCWATQVLSQCVEERIQMAVWAQHAALRDHK
jgi:hypothetical protein